MRIHPAPLSGSVGRAQEGARAAPGSGARLDEIVGRATDRLDIGAKNPGRKTFGGISAATPLDVETAFAPRPRLLAARMASAPSKDLDRFDNPNPERDYTIAFDCPEFTCLCPLTGQPDFAHVHVRYVPDQYCVELKSLKLYLWSYRDEGAFHEAVTNRILHDLVAAVGPREMTVEVDFAVRGGITTQVTATHKKGESPDIPLRGDVGTRTA